MSLVLIEKVLKEKGILESSEIDMMDWKSYFHFIKYFEERENITEHDLIIGANFTYGWMPTIFHFKSENFSDVVSILNKAKNETNQNKLSNFELIKVKELLNNSFVGASKLLHFIKPTDYPIWDSRTCNCMNLLSEKKFKVEKVESFKEYVEFCRELVKNEKFNEIHDNFVKKFDFPVSRLRTAEQIMFLYGKRANHKK